MRTIHAAMNNLQADHISTSLDLDSFKAEVNTQLAHIQNVLQAQDERASKMENIVSRGQADIICRIAKQEVVLTGYIETLGKQISEVVSFLHSSGDVKKG